MFSKQEMSLSEQQAYALRKLHKSLMEHKQAELGEDAKPELLEKARLETLETARLLAENYSQQMIGLYGISMQLKEASYRELRPLVWKVELDTDVKEINSLKGKIDDLLKKLKQNELTREEAKSRIELAIQPYTADYMRQQMLAWRQERLVSEQRSIAAEQRIKALEAQLKEFDEGKLDSQVISGKRDINLDTMSIQSSSSSSSSSAGHGMNIENENKKHSKTLFSFFNKKRKADDEQEEKSKPPSPKKE